MNSPQTNDWLCRMRDHESKKIGEKIAIRLHTEGRSPTMRTIIPELQYMVSTGSILVMNGYIPFSNRLKGTIMIASTAMACKNVLESLNDSEDKALNPPEVIVAEVAKMLWRNRLIFIMPSILSADAMILSFPALRSYIPSSNKHHP